MSRKHNTTHESRGTSNYPRRPGMYRMGREQPTLEHLRGVQERRVRATCTLDQDKHGVHQCNGQPWPVYSEEVMLANVA